MSTLVSVLLGWTAVSLLTCVPIARLIAGGRLQPVPVRPGAEPSTGGQVRLPTSR